MMDFSQIQALDKQYHAETYSYFPIAFTGGKNATLIGTDGKEYIDFGAGIADEFHLRFHILVARERKLRIKQRQFSHRTAINLNPRSGQFHR